MVDSLCHATRSHGKALHQLKASPSPAFLSVEGGLLVSSRLACVTSSLHQYNTLTSRGPGPVSPSLLIDMRGWWCCVIVFSLSLSLSLSSCHVMSVIYWRQRRIPHKARIKHTSFIVLTDDVVKRCIRYSTRSGFLPAASLSSTTLTLTIIVFVFPLLVFILLLLLLLMVIYKMPYPNSFDWIRL